MNQSIVGLLDLPNEMLFNILNKLDNVDVLYSLFGINNERLDSMTCEKIFSNILNFTSIIDNTTILDRFCNYILPRIYYNVRCFIVEPVSMERILLSTHYPNLKELKLFNFQRDSLLCYFTGKKVFYILSIERLHSTMISNRIDYTFNLDDSSFRYIFKQ
jgi:hypothetical protein